MKLALAAVPVVAPGGLDNPGVLIQHASVAEGWSGLAGQADPFCISIVSSLK